MKEEWKDIKGYEGYYQVSNLGRVKSLDRFVPHKTSKNIKINEKILKYHLDDKGYCRIHIHKNNIRKQFKIHKLVANHFLLKKENNYVVDHEDKNKLNNNVNNLRYVSHSKNTRNSNKIEKSYSKYNGVSNHGKNKFRSYIHINGKQIYLGIYTHEKIAALMFNKYCIENNLDRELNIIF